MNRRAQISQVLRQESEIWRAKSYPQLVKELKDVQGYLARDRDGHEFPVEVEVLDQSDTQITFIIAVDDGTFIGGLRPQCETILIKRNPDAGSGESTSDVQG